MKNSLATLTMLTAAASMGHAHFVFVVPETGGASAKVFISETLQPDSAVGLQMVAGAKLSLRSNGGRDTLLSLAKGSDAYVVALEGGGTRTIHGLVDLGLSQNGSAKPYLLLYHPKTILGDAFDGKTLVGEQAPVEIVPLGRAEAVTLQLLARGRPLANAEVTVILPDGSQKKLKTGQTGKTEVLTLSGRYGAWARFWEPGSGEREGKKYDEVRHYATLVFDAPALAATATHFATLPEATASFGSVVSDGWLYVYGGHVAHTHAYSTEAVSGRFSRLRLSGKPEWEQLPSGPAMQGMNLAAYEGKIYRIGGMTPRNAAGTPADNYSTAECARYDPAAKKWEAIPSLPEPRSSHDVAIVDGKLIVTGGWTLRGARSEWLETLAVLDLRAGKLEWKTARQPFKRRALMAAAYEAKMYVVGGFDDKGEIVREVSVYDPRANAWSEGPKLPAGPGLTFAPAAGVHEGMLYVSVSDGTLYRLNRVSREWEKAGSATPRLAHRIASAGKSVLAIGGAANGSNSDLIEAIAVN